MDKKDYERHPVIIKANELAKDIKDFCDVDRQGDAESMGQILFECNKIITQITKLNYGAVCEPRSGCCG